MKEIKKLGFCANCSNYRYTQLSIFCENCKKQEELDEF